MELKIGRNVFNSCTDDLVDGAVHLSECETVTRVCVCVSFCPQEELCWCGAGAVAARAVCFRPVQDDGSAGLAGAPGARHSALR